MLSSWCQHAVPRCKVDGSDCSCGLPMVLITSCKLQFGWRGESTEVEPVLVQLQQLQCQLEGACRRAICRSMQASMSRLVTASLPGLFARSDGTLPCSVKVQLESGCNEQSHPSELDMSPECARPGHARLCGMALGIRDLIPRQIEAMLCGLPTSSRQVGCSRCQATS